MAYVIVQLQKFKKDLTQKSEFFMHAKMVVHYCMKQVFFNEMVL